jgi:hypothetical protein
VDLWALGVCMYQWSFGMLPFSGATLMDTFACISSAPLRIPGGHTASPPLVDAICQVQMCRVCGRFYAYTL